MTQLLARASTADTADAEDHAARIGRIALVTQGVLYLIIGLLALAVARGDRGAEASQTGALEAIARQPFGRVLLILVTLGLVAHAAWRGWLAIVGEPGGDDDAGSLAKRAANVGRAIVYLSFTVVAVRLLTKGEGSQGDQAQESTNTVMDWPAGPWIVGIAGLVIIGVAAWNVRKAITRSFADDLDFSRVDAARKPWVCRLGTVGYLGRGAAFGLIGWFLFDAARQHDASEGRGLDDSLRELTTAPLGPTLLVIVALGLGAFGLFRILDGLLRRDDALTHS
ncbi:DUF1206 domain-containing protein [Aquihabitans daechungensis]|uniref:DUF1206 domain-containing protein n=1 Tax=Aquihabitans daechungensis TaxID=1052257 RepID=UPI003BA26637